MSWPFRLTPKAADDIDEIWWFIAGDSTEAADRVETEIIAACYQLAEGHNSDSSTFLDHH